MEKTNIKQKELTYINGVSVSLGADPELFFKKNNVVIGSEKVIPEKGLIRQRIGTKNGNTRSGSNQGTYESKITQDGVQLEFNISPAYCRAFLGNEMALMFGTLSEELKKKENKGVKLCFDTKVKVSKKELRTLSAKNRVLGCSPSLNAYGVNDCFEDVDPETYLTRTGGGHLHFSAHTHFKGTKEQNEKMIKVLDIILGNTCVLIDRAKGNIERRKYYGKAGEYRYNKKKKILEYRTLSNFWLKAYPLQSLVTELGRVAIRLALTNETTCLATRKTKNVNLSDELFKLVDFKDIQKAINNNDKVLAKKNYDKIKGFLTEVSRFTVTNCYLRDTSAKKDFEFFLSKPSTTWFKSDHLKRWITQEDGHECGFETFLTGIVRNALKKRRGGIVKNG